MVDVASGPERSDGPESVIPTAQRVLTDPYGFFSSMPRSGGYEAPGMFAGILLVATGAVLAVLSLVGLVPGGFFGSLILVPIFGAIGLFIAAAILMFLSRALGGDADYESSFRIVAYCTALSPIHAVTQVIPYLPLLVSAYGFYLMIVAVITVHKVPEQKAWTVLGGLAAVLLFFGLMTAIAARKASDAVDRWSPEIQRQAEELERRARELTEKLERQAESDDR